MGKATHLSQYIQWQPDTWMPSNTDRCLANTLDAKISFEQLSAALVLGKPVAKPICKSPKTTLQSDRCEAIQNAWCTVLFLSSSTGSLTSWGAVSLTSWDAVLLTSWGAVCLDWLMCKSIMTCKPVTQSLMCHTGSLRPASYYGSWQNCC